ncbi:MAG: hypothetical protein AAGB15_09540 [Pseudomonadota bacterium]
MFRKILAAAAVTVAAFAMPAAEAADGKRMTIKGEVIDTWCYFTGVMGGPEAVSGSAHHTCALWCAAGGIPVGVVAEDGTVYMVVKWEGNADLTGDTLLKVQAHEIEADAMVYERDGIHYMVVEKVVNDFGITNLNHDEWGVQPGFAIPKSVTGG